MKLINVFKLSIFYLIIYSSILYKKYMKLKNKLTKQMYNLIKKINHFIYICSKGIILEDIKQSSLEPKFSVIIALFNSKNTIKTAIRSIQNQNENNFEIIIIEDCSTDNSLNVIKKIQKEDSRIKIIIYSNLFIIEVNLK